MTDINAIAFALDPSNVPSFLLDWEVTKRCNLDCSYCTTGIDGGHDNTMQHPPLDECLKTIDFMFEYVDKYMKYKRPAQRKVVLNVYGGESLFHPNIVEILLECRKRYEKYKDNWHMTLHCTTNAIVGARQWAKIADLIDNFTVSYHSETTAKQKNIFKRNVLKLKEINKPFKVSVLMHNNQERWDDCVDAIEFFEQHKIKLTMKALDNHYDCNWGYNTSQLNTFKVFWMKDVSSLNKEQYQKTLDTVDAGDDKLSTINAGRACCGGRKLSINGELKNSVSFIPAQGFSGWSCSVNWFFLFVQQVSGDVFVNKDCRMRFDGSVGPIGNLSKYEHILEELESQLSNKNMPVIKCAKEQCRCGYCAPKAEEKGKFDELMKRHIIDNPLKTN
jgi:pyruvate-formate lyase-activating enzyme